MVGKLVLDPFSALSEEARVEAYEYFDKTIRKLPRDSSGNLKIVGAGLDDNDVDAFRHAYVSGVFTQEFGEKAAEVFGLLNEYHPGGQYSNLGDSRSKNMDLWNNRVGRKYGKKTSGRKTLLKLIHQALKNGELIVDLKDSRKYSGRKDAPERLSKPIVAVQKSNSGRNLIYFDIIKRITMTRAELVALIRAGHYSGYSVKLIRGLETPVSKRDGKPLNNIG